jgi:hypothetical protein
MSRATNRNSGAHPNTVSEFFSLVAIPTRYALGRIANRRNAAKAHLAQEKALLRRLTIACKHAAVLTGRSRSSRTA